MASSLSIILAFLLPCLILGENDICKRHMCGEKFKFWLTTARNRNDQWMTETGLEHPKKPGSAGWKLQVENEAADCDGEEYCRLVASLSAICTTDFPSDGFRSYGVGNYKLFNNESTWDEAKKACEALDAHLAIVESGIDLAALKDVAAQSKTGWIFAGFNDKEKEGVYIDVFGRPVKSYWAKGQPDNAKNLEHCGTINKDGYMNDYPCTAKLSYICEKP